MSSSSYGETFSPGTCDSLSVETIPSASLDLNGYSPNVTHLSVGTRDTSQGVDSGTLPYIQATGHAQSQQTFPNQFQRTYSNRSFKQNYPVPVQTYDDDQHRSNVVPGDEHLLVASHGESATVVCQTHHSTSVTPQHQASLRDIYHQLLSRILGWLTPDDIYRLCDVSPEAQLAGFCNQANFNGIDLFHYFEQRKLITPTSLSYLRGYLKVIGRVDMCGLIDNYMDTYLNRSSLSHGKPLTEPHPPSHEIHLSSCGELHPPPFNPEYCDPMLTQSQIHPTSIVNTFNSGHNQSMGNHQHCSRPTQVEGDKHNDSQTVHAMAGYDGQWQMDYQRTHVDVLMLQKMASTNNEQSHEHNDSTTKSLTQQLNQIHYLLQQTQNELQQSRSKLNSEREKSSKLQQQVDDYKQRIKDCMQVKYCYAMQIDNMSAEAQIKVSPQAEKYPMNKRPHGIAVIINNSEFYFRNSNNEEFPHRKGSQVDEHNLCVTWNCLHYDVRVLRNLTASELTRQLMQIALEDHKNYDSFVCCILSHGELDVVYGTDSQPVKVSDLANLFKGSFCPTLSNKPKLFFIQACRGDNKDQGVVVQIDGGEDLLRHSLPSEADFLFSYATPPGSVSWRSPRYGSWYVSSLCEVFVDNAPHQDLITMLTMVNNKVSAAFSIQGYRQCPAPVTLLRKQVWFFGTSNIINNL